MSDFPVTDLSKIKRSPHRASYDYKAVYDILDAGFICQVGFIDHGKPIIIPMSYGREGDAIYLHGASTSRIVKLLNDNDQVCVSVTHLDGIVVARSMFDTSLNYRSVVLFGKAERVPDDAKSRALWIISEHMLPGRWDEVRQPRLNELAATSILRVTIEIASAKARSGPADDDARDLDLPVWAGLVPLKLQPGNPENDPAMKDSYPVPNSVLNVLRKYQENAQPGIKK